MNNNFYYEKYLKYKNKYLKLKKRPSPSESATQYKVGAKKKGNDKTGYKWC